MRLLQGLNDEQKDAVKTVQGRVLILAGAGSGKTRVLTTRMAHLIENEGVDPSAILGLTFTNKAAEEMRERVSHLLSPTIAKKITLSTFHSFCMQILRQEIHHLGFTSEFTLYDDKDLLRLVKLIARDLLDHDGELPSLTKTIELIKEGNNRGVSSNDFKKTESKWHDQFTKDVYNRLQDSLRAYNVLDFDHLLSKTVELFRAFPSVLEKYQNRFRYIMIDEYQDTNKVQFQLAELLSQKYQNLCVVGDDDQAIYGWRGAEVKNILEFEADKKIKLEQNYRSHNTILKAANHVISHNSSRFKKSLWSGKGDGHLIEVFVAPGELEEAEAVASRIAKLKEKHGVSFSDIAIIYRSNSLATPLEVALLKQKWLSNGRYEMGIPFEVFGGVDIFERREIKDLLAYLRVIVNPLDEEALLRVINLPRRGIGEASLDKMTAISRKEGISLFKILEEKANNPGEILTSKAAHSLNDFLSIIKEGKQRFVPGRMEESISWLIKRTQFKKSIEEDVKSDKMREFKWENVQNFASSFKKIDQEGEEGNLSDFIGSLALHMNQDNFSLKKDKKEKVSLMTIHSAKGLEFEACFLVGIEDQLIPHEKSILEGGIEEERRLMYVAITRAKKWLTISMTKKRKRMGKEIECKPSRFLFEIPKEYLKPVLWHEI